MLEGEDLRGHYRGMIEEAMESVTAAYDPNEEEAFKAVNDAVRKVFPISLAGLEGQDREALIASLIERAKQAYEAREKEIGADFLRHLERMILLDIVDSKWKEHLRGMDNLREGIGLRAYGQKDPLVEYKREAFEAFGAMIDSIKEDALEFIFRVQPVEPGKVAAQAGVAPTKLQFLHPEAASAVASLSEAAAAGDGPAQAPRPPLEHRRTGAPVVAGEKIGRNDPCSCGSGKKYKKCHGA